MVTVNAGKEIGNEQCQATNVGKCIPSLSVQLSFLYSTSSTLSLLCIVFSGIFSLSVFL